MSDDHAQRRAAVRHGILRYLEQHPRASDTAAGIGERWLPGEGMNEDLGVVESVLDELVDAGLIRLIELPGGARAYGGLRPPEPGSGE